MESKGRAGSGKEEKEEEQEVIAVKPNLDDLVGVVKEIYQMEFKRTAEHRYI